MPEPDPSNPIPSRPFDDASSGPSVLIPVTAGDHARRQWRMRMMLAAGLVGLAVVAAWIYKRQVDPITALESFDAGERQLRAAHYAQAIASFDRAIALAPSYADAYLMRGRTNISLQNPQAAIADFTKVIDLRPRDPVGLLDRGSVHLNAKEYPEALADFTRAVELDPRLDLAYNLRGVTLRTMGKPKEALEDLNRAVALRDNVDNRFQRAATLQVLDQHQAAIEDLNRVIAYQPDSSEAYFARSLSLRAVGDNAAADRDHATGRRLDAR